MDLKLSGKTALVTGSYRGTGWEIARHLLREGAKVFVHGLRPGQAEAAVEELGGGVPVTGDISTDAGANDVVSQFRRPNNKDKGVIPSLDILINNYGTADAGSWEQSESKDWINAYEKNVLSAQRMIRAFLPDMKKRAWGRIINLGTLGSTQPNSRMPHYYAAKGALATMTISLAKELAGTGVRVNLVSPGIILTPEVQANYLELGKRKGWGDTWQEIEPHVAKGIPIGRVVRRADVANLILFLASPLADAIHGQNLKMDGGSLGILL